MSNEARGCEVRLGRRSELMLSAEFRLLRGGVVRTGWCFCIDARSASVSIDCVEVVLLYSGVGLVPVGTGEMRGEECEG